MYYGITSPAFTTAVRPLPGLYCSVPYRTDPIGRNNRIWSARSPMSSVYGTGTGTRTFETVHVQQTSQFEMKKMPMRQDT